MSVTIGKDGPGYCIEIKNEVPEDGEPLNEKSTFPVIEVKQEVVEVQLLEQQSPNKQKRKYVRKPKAEVAADAEPKPKRKYGRKPKIESPIKDASINSNNKVDLSVSKDSEDLLNSSNNADTTAELNDLMSPSSVNSSTIAENKPRVKRTWSRRKKANVSENNSTAGEDLVSTTIQGPTAVPENSTQTPESNNVEIPENCIPEVKKRKGRTGRTKPDIIKSNISNAVQKWLEPIKNAELAEGQSDMNSVQEPIPAAVSQAAPEMSTNLVKVEGWKPKRPVPTTRRTKLLTFTEMPERPIDEKERKAIINKNKRKPKGIKKEAQELEQLKKEAQELEQLKKEAQELEQLKKEAQELEQLKKEAQKLEKLKREAQELEKLKMEAQELEKLKMEAQELEQLKKETQELEKSRLYSELPEISVERKEKKVVNSRNKRKPKEDKVKEEVRELETPTEMDVSEKNDDQTTTNANATTTDSAQLKDMSVIDGDDMESHFLENEASDQCVPMDAAIEINLMASIDDVAKGEGDINPNIVSFPRRISTRTRTMRRSYISPTHTPIPRRVSKRKSQEFGNLINIEANERVPAFQDIENDNFSVSTVEGIERADENDYSDDSDDDEPIVYNTDTCSVCRWKIRPDDPESEDLPRRKNHKFTYSMQEKNDLYADGQFLMDEYEIEKNREHQVLWRIIDSCMCVQRFDPYEANGRVFHHGTDHYHIFTEKDWGFYQRFQPVYAVLILENDDYQMAILISVDRLLPCLPLLSRTENLFDSYKVVIQMMISANLERNFIPNQLKGEDGDIYFSANWEKINSVITCRVREIWNADHWTQGVFNILTNFPRLIYSRLVSAEKLPCSTCKNPDRKAVFKLKCLGGPYNPETFEPLPAPAIPICQICYYCQPLIKSFMRLYHHQFLLFGCIQKNISHLLSDLAENEKCDGLELLKNMMDDHEWILNLFLEFQVVLAEADKSISQIVADPNKPARARNVRKPKK